MARFAFGLLWIDPSGGRVSENVISPLAAAARHERKATRGPSTSAMFRCGRLFGHQRVCFGEKSIYSCQHARGADAQVSNKIKQIRKQGCLGLFQAGTLCREAG